jgi:hypothetical protein
MESGGKVEVSFLLRDVLLKPGQYFLGLWLGGYGIEDVDHIEHVMAFNVLERRDDSEHPILYPGIYLCRFEENVRIRSQVS